MSIKIEDKTQTASLSSEYYADGEDYNSRLQLLISELEEKNEQLLVSQRQLQDIFDFLPDATMVIDREHRVIKWNRAMEKMTGRSAVDMMGKGEYEYALPFYSKRRPILADFVLDSDGEMEKYYGVFRLDGDAMYIETYIPELLDREVYLWAKASPLFNQRGEVVGAIETIRDITDLKKAQRELEYLSSYDNLTGLYNRASFDKLMKKLEEEKNRPVTVIVCDVNGLKSINDNYGHAEGDEWLRMVAEIIREAFRPSDMVARIGGDEFGILLPNIGFKTGEKAVERIEKGVEDFNNRKISPHVMSIAVGKATAELYEHLVIEAFRTADRNMYLDKMIKKQQF